MSARSPRPLLVVPDLSLAPESRWLEALSGLPRSLLAVQLRMPHAPAARLLRWGHALRGALGPDVPLVVNDRLDVALALRTPFVHLGRLSVGVGEARSLLGPGAWVSRSCHGIDELTAASREGADAALVSPVFASPGKGPPLGLTSLAAMVAAFPRLSLFALGGVDASTASSCLRAGVRGVAVVRAALDPTPWRTALPWPDFS